MRKKLFTTYVIIILFLSGILGFFTVTICRKYYTEEYGRHLIKEVKLLGDILSDTDKSNETFGKFAQYYSEKLGCRITIIDSNGVVLKDSQAEESGLENHRNREEIIEALNGEVAIANRYSNSMKTQYMYAAVSIDIGNEILVLRISVPLVELSAIKNQVIVYIFSGITITALIAFLFAYFFADKIAEPLNELTLAAEEIAKGNYGKKIPINRNDQIGSLTKAFNQMSSQLYITIDKLEGENVKMESIVNSMINGVIAIDNQSRILMINDVSYKLFNIKIKNITGYNFYDIIRNEDVFRLLEAAAEQKTHVVEEFVLKGNLEGDKILRIYVNPISAENKDNKELGKLLVFQDVTQIRKLEQLRSNFVSNVTHELKTPLTSIMGFTDTLKSGVVNDTETTMRFIDIIDIEAKRLYRLILDILSLSEIETRNEDVNVTENSINDIMSSVFDILNPTAKSKKLTLTFHVDDNVEGFICNKDRISQLFINLTENAIKYTEEGSVIVNCRKEENFLEISVSDTGIGIPNESLERIFERFYRVDKGRARKAGGTGLGLSIVKHIVLLYDGNISIESEEGKGSKFTIKLPYKRMV